MVLISLLAAAVIVYAINAWSIIRLREVELEHRRLSLEEDHEAFGQQQHIDLMKIHNEQRKFPSAGMRSMMQRGDLS